MRSPQRETAGSKIKIKQDMDKREDREDTCKSEREEQTGSFEKQAVIYFLTLHKKTEERFL